MKSRPQTLTGLLFLTIILMSALAGCSDSPTEPEAPPGDEGFVDVPVIPVPASPGGEVPAKSATLTIINPLPGTYRPNLTDAYGLWEAVRFCGTSSSPLREYQDWTGTVSANRDYHDLIKVVLGRNLILQDSEGVRRNLAASSTTDFDCGAGSFPTPGRVAGSFRGDALETPVFVRRDRHWELKPLEGGAGNHLLVYPQTSGEVATVYRQGTQTTQTQEFGKSLTAEVGLSYGVLAASVSGTLSETFSSAVTVRQESEESFTKSVTGKEGKIIQFMVWELVEEYSFCDAEGKALTSKNYVIAPESITLRGTSVALQSTEFDLP